MQNSQLSPSAKRFVMTLQNRVSNDSVGIDGVNVTGNPFDRNYVIIAPYGLVYLCFYEAGFMAQERTAEFIYHSVFTVSKENLFQRLHTHGVLKNDEGALRFPVRVLCVFPDVKEPPQFESTELQGYVNKYCLFDSWCTSLKKPNAADECFRELMKESDEPVDPSFIRIDNEMRDVIINRIAPWATIPRMTEEDHINAEKQQKAALYGEVLPTDSMVEVLRLDQKQIDEVNRITKGHQLILACAGSGKSVILIARCFKLASLNKSKKYLLVCYNRNLMDYYDWQIDEAGFSESNLKCCRFFQLCLELLANAKIPQPMRYANEDDNAFFAEVAQRVYQGLVSGKIKERYHGIFIDEVQRLEPLWYRICYMLLENPDTDDHVFTICGDLTQNMKKNVRRGLAPWQGEGLPVFTGHTIHIEKNYRNSVPINRFINHYSDLTRSRLPEAQKMEASTYLRGKAFREGTDPLVVYYNTDIKDSRKIAQNEAVAVLRAVEYMHDTLNIGYADIAVLMYNRGIDRKSMYHNGYSILSRVENCLANNDIKSSKLSWLTNQDRPTSYKYRDGVSLITFEGSLGIDFRGIVVCGLSLIGARLKIQNETPGSIQKRTVELQDEYYLGFDAMYVACTRAKDSLALILPEKGSEYETAYTRLIQETIDTYNADGEGEVQIL